MKEVYEILILFLEMYRNILQSSLIRNKLKKDKENNETEDKEEKKLHL